MKGKKTGGGSRKGKPNKLTAELKETILNAFGKLGGEAYLVKVGQENPVVFCNLLGKVLPLQVAGDPHNPLVVKLVQFAGTP